MTKVSDANIEKIKESILSILYHNSPKAMFGAEIAREIIRDEEFAKKLLIELEKKGLVTSIRKNPNGINYVRRARWRLTSQAFKAYNDVTNVQPNV